MITKNLPLRQPIVIDNGPATYKTQLPQGLTVPIPQPLVEGDTLIVVYSAATFGGAHTGCNVTSALGNKLEPVKEVAGLPHSAGGSVNQSQALIVFAGPVTVAGQDSIHAQYVGGDLDSQAAAVLVLEGQFTVLGSDGTLQSAVAFNAAGNGDNVITSRLSSGVPVTAAQLPVYLLGISTNISELSQTGNYTPQPGDRMSPLITAWPYDGANPQNLPNLLIADQYVTSASEGLQTYFSTLTAGEYWETIMLVLQPGTPPPASPTVWTLTATQVDSLVAGTAVQEIVPVDIPPGSILELKPPAPASGGGSGGGGGTPGTLPALKVSIFSNGKFGATADWNAAGQPMDYAYAAAGVAGPGPVIDFPAYPGNPYWLPYLQNTPGNGNPASNGVGYNAAGCTQLVFAVKPSQAGFDLAAGVYEAQGTTNDIQYGASVYVSQHPEWKVAGPGIGTPGEWSVYAIPLSTFGAPLDWYYKIILDKQGSTPVQDVQLDYVGFA